MYSSEQPVSLETKVGDSEDTVHLDLLSGGEDLPDEINLIEMGFNICLMFQLPYLHCWVLRMRYGMDGNEPISLSGVGKILGISRDRVKNIEREGLIGLRKLSDNSGFYSDYDTNQQTSFKAFPEYIEEKKN